jgi:hypothetical protein
MVRTISSMAKSLGQYFGRLRRRQDGRQVSSKVGGARGKRSIAGSPVADDTDKKSDAIIKAINIRSLATRPAPTTVIFLHYHPSEYFAPGFVQLINSAWACGYRVVVVSSSRPSRAKRYFGDFEFVYIQRENKGYDFGALRDARELLARHGLLTESRYVIINSSLLNVASKGFGCDQILDRLAEPEREFDLLGVTSSYEQRIYHIQSYYYSFSAKLFCSSDLDAYFQGYWLGLSTPQRRMAPRDYAIKHGELGLTSYVLNKGYTASSMFEHFHIPSPKTYLTMESLCLKVQSMIREEGSLDSLPMSRVGSIPSSFMTEWRAKPGLQTNISQACWALLLSNGFLFIKRELLENYQPHNHCHARSAAAMLMPVLNALDIEIPNWSDLHVLNRLVFASKSEH